MTGLQVVFSFSFKILQTLPVRSCHCQPTCSHRPTQSPVTLVEKTMDFSCRSLQEAPTTNVANGAKPLTWSWFATVEHKQFRLLYDGGTASMESRHEDILWTEWMSFRHVLELDFLATSWWPVLSDVALTGNKRTDGFLFKSRTLMDDTTFESLQLVPCATKMARKRR